ncbi:MAG: hypothetical protein RMX97_16265 [Nostoc sp. DedQUE11]|nr:hypothetical protein [Nostoc sp. DedQUE11]
MEYFYWSNGSEKNQYHQRSNTRLDEEREQLLPRVAIVAFVGITVVG